MLAYDRRLRRLSLCIQFTFDSADTFSDIRICDCFFHRINGLNASVGRSHRHGRNNMLTDTFFNPYKGGAHPAMIDSGSMVANALTLN